MVTGYARMKLYSIIDQIESSKQGRTLYFDTDSVIYIDDPSKGWENPPIGDFLGDMTDEIEKDYGPNAYIDEFASGGPKNYGYNVINPPNPPKTCTKIKGLNITEGLKHKLNFETVKKYAKKYRLNDKREKVVPQLQFRSERDHTVYTKVFDKKYRVVSEKRIVVPEGEYQTLPYGYIEEE